MHRQIILFLLAAAPGLFGASRIEPGVFGGSWAVTNRDNFVISGTLTIVFPESGRPTVHFYFPVFTNDTVEVVPYIKTAARPTRRSIVWTVRGFGRLHGVQQMDGATETISGRLRLHGHGHGTFTVERFMVATQVTNSILHTNIVIVPPSFPPFPPTPVPGNHQTNIIFGRPPIVISNAPPIIRITNEMPAEVNDGDSNALNARIDMFLQNVKRRNFLLSPPSRFRKLSP